MADDSNILTKASVKVAELIGRFLPEPTPEKGAWALQAAIVVDIAWFVVVLLVAGLGSAIVQGVIVTAILLLGMFAGVAAFDLNKNKHTRGGPTV